jgi:hypothetical protein
MSDFVEQWAPNILILVVIALLVFIVFWWRRSRAQLAALRRNFWASAAYKLDQFEFEKLKFNTLIFGVAAIVSTLLLVSAVIAALWLSQTWRSDNHTTFIELTPPLEQFLRSRLPDPDLEKQRHEELIRAIGEIRSPGPALTSSALEELVRARVPDLQAQRERHEEVIKEIRATRSSGSDARADKASVFLTPQGWILVCLFVIFVIVVAILISRAWLKSAIAITLTASLGGIVLVKNFNLVEKIESLVTINFSYATGSSRSKDSPPPPAQERTEFDCGKEETQRIGPFVEGSGDELMDPDAQTKLNSVVNLFKPETASSKRLLGLILIGSADRRPLKPKLLRQYGSNDGLAQTRARWVKGVLSDKLDSINPDTIVTLPGGPSIVGLISPDTNLSFDRAVQVCAFWAVKS